MRLNMQRSSRKKNAATRLRRIHCWVAWLEHPTRFVTFRGSEVRGWRALVPAKHDKSDSRRARPDRRDEAAKSRELSPLIERDVRTGKPGIGRGAVLIYFEARVCRETN